MLIVDVTSLHVWSESIITLFSVICFIIIILVFIFDSLFSLHLSFFSYSDPSWVWYFLHIIITHLTINLICFICLLIYTMFTLGTIGYLGLVSLHFYHPITLAYVTSRVLRPPWGYGIRCHLWQPLLGQVFEIWLLFRYYHASSSGRRLSDG